MFPINFGTEKRKKKRKKWEVCSVFFFFLWVRRVGRLEVARTCIYDTNAQGYRTARCLHQYAILRKHMPWRHPPLPMEGIMPPLMWAHWLGLPSQTAGTKTPPLTWFKLDIKPHYSAALSRARHTSPSYIDT